MDKISKKPVVITLSQQIIGDVYDMWIEDKETALQAKAGQFISLYCKSQNRLLPRPISICEVDKEQGRIRFVYRAFGKGTQEIAGFKAGDIVEMMGPLGNGYTLEGKKAILIGGGIGIPPMLELAKQLNCEKSIVLGYRDMIFLEDEFKEYGPTFIATEDGSKGVKGNVLDAIRENKIEGDIIFACGPTPMLRGIKAYAMENGIKAQLSLEERMACGIGACLACTCKSKEKDEHTHVNNKRICKEGPVFYAEEVEI